MPVVESEAVHVSGDGLKFVEHIAVFDYALILTKTQRGEEVEHTQVEGEHLLGCLLVGFVQSVLNLVGLLDHVDKATVLLVGLFNFREFKEDIPIGDVPLNFLSVAAFVLRFLLEDICNGF